MKRNKMIQHLYNELNDCKNWNEVRKVFSECIDWNEEHSDEEIYMCEGDDNTVSIEDDYVSFDF